MKMNILQISLSHIEKANNVWHDFIHNKIDKTSIIDAYCLATLNANLVDEHIYGHPIVVKANDCEDSIEQASMSIGTSADETKFFKSFLSLCFSEDFCADLVESALKNNYCSIMNPFGDGIDTCNTSFHFDISGGISALRFVSKNNEIYFIIQKVNSVDGIYFPARNTIVLLTNSLWEKLINSIVKDICARFISVIKYIRNSLENKFGGITVNTDRPSHYYYNFCLGLYVIYQRNIVKDISTIYIRDGGDLFPVKELFNFNFDTNEIFYKDFTYLSTKSQNCKEFYLCVGSNGLNPVNKTTKMANEEISRMIVSTSSQLIDTSTANQVRNARNCYPLIWFGVTAQKRAWVEQVEGGAKIITELAKIYPNIGVVFDGWTCSLHPSQSSLAQAAKDNSLVDKIVNLLPEKIKTFNVVGANTVKKLAFSNVIDAFISNYGTGSIHVARFARKPGVGHFSNGGMKQYEKFNIHYRTLKVPSDKVIDIPDSNPNKAQNNQFTSYSINPEVISKMIKEIIACENH